MLRGLQVHYEVIDNWLFHCADFKTLTLAKKYIKSILLDTSESYIINYVRIRKVFDAKENKKVRCSWRIPLKLSQDYRRWVEVPE